MFSASPARITSGRHVPEQTEPLEKIRVLGAQEHTNCAKPSKKMASTQETLGF